MKAVKNTAGQRDLSDLSDVCALLMVVLQKKQHDRKNVKTAALSITIVEVDDLLFAAVPS